MSVPTTYNGIPITDPTSPYKTWNGFPYTDLSVAQMVADYATLRALPSGTYPHVQVRGSANAVTGINGLFAWDATSTATDNGGTVIKPTDVGGGAGRWKRIYTDAIDVRWFGATGDGVTDDTTAIQNAITAAISVGNETSVSRKGVARLRFTLGTYLITAPLQFHSVQFLDVDFGGSTIRVSGALAAVLDLNGVAYSEFRHLAITGNTSSDSATDVIRLSWVGTNRSTTDVKFNRITVVQSLKFVTAFNCGYNSAASQVDQIMLENCTANGNWVSGETTWWQTGFLLGSGTFGNILCYNGFFLTANHCAIGLNNNATNVAVFGWQSTGNQVDFYGGHTSWLTVQGFRSEGAERLFTGRGPTTTGSYTEFANGIVAFNAVNADGQWIKHPNGGSLVLRNILGSTNPLGRTLTINAGDSQRPLSITMVGLSVPQSYATAFTISDQVFLDPRPYLEINTSSVLLNAVWGGAYTPKSGNYTATAVDRVVAVDATGASRTITLPSTAPASGIPNAIGREITVKKTDASANTVTVSRSAADTTAGFAIDGATSKVLHDQYAAVTLRNNGAGWDVVSAMGTIT